MSIGKQYISMGYPLGFVPYNNRFIYTIQLNDDLYTLNKSCKDVWEHFIGGNDSNLVKENNSILKYLSKKKLVILLDCSNKKSFKKFSKYSLIRQGSSVSNNQRVIEIGRESFALSNLEFKIWCYADGVRSVSDIYKLISKVSNDHSGEEFRVSLVKSILSLCKNKLIYIDIF